MGAFAAHVVRQQALPCCLPAAKAEQKMRAGRRQAAVIASGDDRVHDRMLVRRCGGAGAGRVRPADALVRRLAVRR
jgi:hypothetical protein